MATDKISRKFHLQNIQGWLDLAKTPIRKAQEGTAIALEEHYGDSDTDAMTSVTDVANAVNTALVWVMCAQDMIGEHLGKDDLLPDASVAFDKDSPGTLVCDACASEFGEHGPVVLGDICPMCSDGVVESLLPF